ncbi:MAG: Histidine-specific methyltransferase, SAM-dependent [Solirubrobacteraceae bacterium]|jgi:hypothetical protein|nr:Histidine-specific methyltransferase, SAM-dependent [Solirubrobacteraceae bacterium]
MVRPPSSHADEVRQALAERTILPAHLFYETAGGAANWTDLTCDAAYASANDSADLFRRDGDAIGMTVAAMTAGRSISLVSLGPGNGWKDELVMAAIDSAAAHGSMHYYALDTSVILATQAMTRALTNPALAASGVHASALVARFDDLPELRPIYDAGSGVNVILMLGNTLGNLADETGLLRLLAEDAMNEGDLLVLEMTLQTPGTDEIASLGELDLIRRFNFEPLASLGLQLVPEQLTYTIAPDRSTIPGTLSIVANYRDFVVDGKHVASADLAYVHRYVDDAIPRALADVGLRPCGPPWFGPSRRSMLVLARREPSQAR